MSTSAKYRILVSCLLVAGYGSFIAWRWAQGPAQVGAGNAANVSRSTLSASSQALPASPVADFVLTDQDGQTFDSGSLRGKVWVASFFFTNCPAVCWRMNQALAAYQQTHPESDTRFVSITCDPANDTPEALKRYAEHFKADPQRWTFLTGDLKEIQSIGQDSFKISVVEKDHTDRACVVDRNGQVRGRFRLTEPDQVAMLERLLAAVDAEEPAVQDPRDRPDGDEAGNAAPADQATASVPLSE